MFDDILFTSNKSSKSLDKFLSFNDDIARFNKFVYLSGVDKQKFVYYNISIKDYDKSVCIFHIFLTVLVVRIIK